MSKRVDVAVSSQAGATVAQGGLGLFAAEVCLESIVTLLSSRIQEYGTSGGLCVFPSCPRIAALNTHQ